MAGQITRVTLFKIPKEEDQQRLLDLYKEMPQKATKVCNSNSRNILFSNQPQIEWEAIHRLSQGWKGSA